MYKNLINGWMKIEWTKWLSYHHYHHHLYLPILLWCPCSSLSASQPAPLFKHHFLYAWTAFYIHDDDDDDNDDDDSDDNEDDDDDNDDDDSDDNEDDDSDNAGGDGVSDDHDRGDDDDQHHLYIASSFIQAPFYHYISILNKRDSTYRNIISTYIASNTSIVVRQKEVSLIICLFILYIKL